MAAAVVLGFALTAALCSLFVPLRRVLERREQNQQPAQSCLLYTSFVHRRGEHSGHREINEESVRQRTLFSVYGHRSLNK